MKLFRDDQQPVPHAVRGRNALTLLIPKRALPSSSPPTGRAAMIRHEHGHSMTL